jgi:uncharacterized metal-binding protein YceD (DUF177 family)
MSEVQPFTHLYNLNRLGQVGDEVTIRPAEEERAALARFSDVLAVKAFAGHVALNKLSPNRFRLDYTLAADIVQSCVVTLAEVPAHIERQFTRELHFSPALRRNSAPPPAEDVVLEADEPEEIDSLHHDLAGALIEELILAIDPYPRASGVEFQAPNDGDKVPESPFAVLKGLKSGL